MSASATPSSVEELVELVNDARSGGHSLWFAGSGTVPQPPDHEGVVVSSTGMSGVVDYKPGDLTAVVRAGTTLAEFDEELAENRHSAVLPETGPGRSIGGVVATGAFAYRRLRYGPTRDRVIGVTMVTGYGEVIHGGGQLVKNVTGFDVPRLVTGSMGSLGFIVDVSFKLVPLPPVQVTVTVSDAGSARLSTYRPVAALETERGCWLYLEGSQASVSAQLVLVGGSQQTGHVWPARLEEPVRVVIAVPPRFVSDCLEQVRATGATRFVAQHGVGTVEVGWTDVDAAHIGRLRGWAESVGGSLALTRRGSLDLSVPVLGTPPSSIGIQRRMKELFDPDRVCNPGLLPGGL